MEYLINLKKLQILAIISSLFFNFGNSLLVIDGERDPKQFKGQICEENKVYNDPKELDKFYLCRYNYAYRVWIAYAFTCPKFKIFNPIKQRCEYSESQSPTSYSSGHANHGSDHSNNIHLKFPGIFYPGNPNKVRNSTATTAIPPIVSSSTSTNSAAGVTPFNSIVHQYDMSTKLSGLYGETGIREPTMELTSPSTIASTIQSINQNHQNPWPFLNSLTQTIGSLATSINSLSQILHVSINNISKINQPQVHPHTGPPLYPSHQLNLNLQHSDSPMQFSLGSRRSSSPPPAVKITTELNIIDEMSNHLQEEEFILPNKVNLREPQHSNDDLIEYFEEDVKRVKTAPPGQSGQGQGQVDHQRSTSVPPPVTINSDNSKNIYNKTTPRATSLSNLKITTGPSKPSPFRTRTISNDFFPVKVLRFPLSHRSTKPPLILDEKNHHIHNNTINTDTIETSDKNTSSSIGSSISKEKDHQHHKEKDESEGRMNSRRPQF